MTKKLKVEIEIDVDWFSTEDLEELLKSKFYSMYNPYNIKVREIKNK